MGVATKDSGRVSNRQTSNAVCCDPKLISRRVYTTNLIQVRALMAVKSALAVANFISFITLAIESNSAGSALLVEI